MWFGAHDFQFYNYEFSLLKLGFFSQNVCSFCNTEQMCNEWILTVVCKNTCVI